MTGLAQHPEQLGVYPADQDVVAQTPTRLALRRLRRDPVGLVAFGLIVLLILTAIFAPQIVSLAGAHPPNQQNTAALDQFGSPRGPSAHYLFGTDDLGRDVFSRTVYGARISLEVALIATALTVVIGVALGLLSGYYGGRVDTFISRGFDVVLAFPILLFALGLGAACSFGSGCIPVNYRHVGFGFLAIAVIAIAIPILFHLRRCWRQGRRISGRALIGRALPGIVLAAIGVLAIHNGSPHSALIHPGVPTVIFILTLGGIPYMGRIIRGQTLSLRERDFVEALKSLGASNGRILRAHLLPNLIAPIIVYSTILIPQNILFEAALSFIGIGVQPPTSDWGTMIASAIGLFQIAWWYMTFPGLALLITVLAFNVFGDSLQDALAPQGVR